MMDLLPTLSMETWFMVVLLMGLLLLLYDGCQPIIAVLDPSVIKAVLVKECYSTFTNRRAFPAPNLLRNAVSMAQDEQWKRIRTVLSPTFTSGKLKEMFPIIKHYGEILIQNVQKKMENDEPIDVKDIFGAYSMDVVTSTSFGIDVNSMNNPKDPFVKQIKKLTKFKSFDPRVVLAFMFPKLMTIFSVFNISPFSREALNFFTKSFLKMKESRLKEGEGMMIASQNNNKDSINNNKNSTSNGVDHRYKGLTDNEILAQAFIFVFAGYEPTSNTLGYMAYSLATHPDAPLTYDAIMQLEYLDMVLNESQRLYPLGGRIERVCKMDVEINGMTIPKGTVVMIPPLALHQIPLVMSNQAFLVPEKPIILKLVPR
ncbi:hypothetical protein E2320_012216 [Naja naja]|nr:hypothetical protein E2320_012216 [Naja naja]